MNPPLILVIYYLLFFLSTKINGNVFLIGNLLINYWYLILQIAFNLIVNSIIMIEIFYL